eukprot:TRINITY_DN589_c0_g1_i1.p1 TRINITY_DN589_c0_g1~~TRINITY_DN589_c0_g1_i1.p1  ORF type:complete len:183 (-),score=45.65 TRINITY_DN589_c0_g1_i1:335-802(-)
MVRIGSFEVAGSKISMVMLSLVFAYLSLAFLLAFLQYWHWGTILYFIFLVLLTLTTFFAGFFHSRIAIVAYWALIGLLLVLLLLSWVGIFEAWSSLGTLLAIQGLLLSSFMIIFFLLSILIGLDLWQHPGAHWGVPWKKADEGDEYGGRDIDSVV